MSVGIAIITCDREKMLNNCVQSIIEHTQDIDVKHVLIINDGESVVDHKDFELIDNDRNLGVGECKSIALNRLMELNCEHIFLLEDDIKLCSDVALQEYIKLSDASGVKHLNFCLHGHANKRLDVPAPKLVIDYKDIQMALYHNVTGAVSYYHRSVIEQCGVMDRAYKNAMEHVDHTMRIIQAGYHPPFRWFADVANSDQLICDQDPSLSESKIRNNDVWKENFIHGVKLFYERYNVNVCAAEQPCDTKQQVIDYLKSIKP